MSRTLAHRSPATRNLVVAGGAVAVALVLAVPSLGWGAGNEAARSCAAGSCPASSGAAASGGQGSGRGAGLGTHQGQGQGRGQGRGQGQGQGAGVGTHGAGDAHAEDPLAGLAKGTLTPTQARALAAMAEEEKLAHDVYAALAEKVDDARLVRIAQAESRHLDELRALLTRYGIADPTVGRAAGQFADAAQVDTYRTLVRDGSGSVAAATAVGRTIEAQDIADLTKAGDGITAPDVKAIYANLTAGSQRHLAAFSR